jgi:hypothetical protein
MLKSFHYSSGETTRGAQVLLHEAFNNNSATGGNSGESTRDSDWEQHVIHLCGQVSVGAWSCLFFVGLINVFVGLIIKCLFEANK